MVAQIKLSGNNYTQSAICKLGIGIGIGNGIGIGTDITNAIISSSIRPMDPNLSRVVTQDEGTPPTKSRRYRGHVANKKRYISTFTRLVDSKLSRVVTQYDGISSTKSRNTSITWSRDKLKTLYLHFYQAYRHHQTLQGSDSG